MFLLLLPASSVCHGSLGPPEIDRTSVIYILFLMGCNVHTCNSVPGACITLIIELSLAY